MGGFVNTRIVIAAGARILQQRNPSAFVIYYSDKEYGPNIS